MTPVQNPPMSCDQIRAFDRFAIEQLGVPSIVLMENAARSIAEEIIEVCQNDAAAAIVILCGPGNNGGDAYAVGRHLVNAGFGVQLIRSSAPAASALDAALNDRICRKMEIPLIEADRSEGLEAAIVALRAAKVVVDGLLGSGTRGAPRGNMVSLINAANQANAKRIAIDIPTGLDADTGFVHDTCFRADRTVTLLAMKLGFSTSAARAVLGRVVVAGIGIDARFGQRNG